MLISPSLLELTELNFYSEELVLSLSMAREVAALHIRRAQVKYKKLHDKKAKLSTFKIGEWVLVRFPMKSQGV